MSDCRNDPLKKENFFMKLREKKDRFCKQLLRVIFLYNIWVYFRYQYTRSSTNIKYRDTNVISKENQLFSNSFVNSYLFITPSQTGLNQKHSFLVVVELRSIFYSSKIVCLPVDWFTEYYGIMIEHYRSWTLWIVGRLLKLLFSVNCQTTVAYRVDHSLYFHQMWVPHTANYITPFHIWVGQTVRNVGLPHLGFSFPVGPPPFFICNRSFRSC